MNIFLLLIIIIFFSSLMGFIFGLIGANLKKTIENKRLIKEAKKVLNGDKKNETTDENGSIYEVKEFKIRNKDDKEIKVNLAGEPLKDG